MHKVLVIGTGPAGLTAAIYLARALLEPIVIEGKQPGGQLTTTTEVDNFPGFPKGILGPELIEAMKDQAKRFGAKFLNGWVKKVDLSSRPFKVILENSEVLKSESIIVSTGASPKFLNIPGESQKLGQGVSTCATCDGFFYKDKQVIVVGGGDSAMEEANFLTRFAKKVTIVHRRFDFRASKIMQKKAKDNPKIEFVLNKTPISVEIKEEKVIGLKVKDNASGEEDLVFADGIFIAIGHVPNTSFLEGQLKTDKQGYIWVEPGTTKTSIEGVFACGDVQDPIYRQAITAAGTGCMAALDCERYLENISV